MIERRMAGVLRRRATRPTLWLLGITTAIVLANAGCDSVTTTQHAIAGSRPESSASQSGTAQSVAYTRYRGYTDGTGYPTIDYHTAGQVARQWCHLSPVSMRTALNRLAVGGRVNAYQHNRLVAEALVVKAYCSPGTFNTMRTQLIATTGVDTTDSPR